MKNSVTRIMYVGRRAEAYTDKLQKEIERLSVIINGNAEEQFVEILDLIDKKRLVMNMHIMRRMIHRGLLKEESEILELYSNRFSLENIAKRVGLHKTTVMRKVEKIIKKAALILEKRDVSS